MISRLRLKQVHKKYEEIYDKTQYDGYLDKIRDIDVFEKFDFIKLEV